MLRAPPPPVLSILDEIELRKKFHASFLISEGYTILRQRFGNDSFWLHGPYHYIMKAIFQGEGFYRAFSLHPFTAGQY
jgi:hypothetical protein